MSNENTASSGAIGQNHVKTPTRMDRANHTMQNFYKNQTQNQRNSIKCLEVLSKQVTQGRVNKSRKIPLRASSNVNKTYDIRTGGTQYGDRNHETRENEKYFQKMEAIRREKRNKYEQAVFK